MDDWSSYLSLIEKTAPRISEKMSQKKYEAAEQMFMQMITDIEMCLHWIEEEQRKAA